MWVLNTKCICTNDIISQTGGRVGDVNNILELQEDISQNVHALMEMPAKPLPQEAY